MRRDQRPAEELSASHPDIVADIRARVDRLIQMFPPGIVDAWQYTLSQKVLDAPIDGLPVPGGPRLIACLDYYQGADSIANTQ